jgi:peptide/nickel transport system substrate-binding protein
MPDLRQAAEDILAQPLFEPTPVAELEARADVLVRQRRRRLQALTIVAAVALVLALAGSVGLAATSGSRNARVASEVPPATSTTTAVAAEETTSTAAAASSASATTAAAASGTATTVGAGSTATTAKATAATTAKKSVATGAVLPRAQSNLLNVQAGIANVTAPTTVVGTVPPQSGGTLTMLTSADVNGFDPVSVANTGVDGLPAAAVFDMLVYSDSSTGSVSAQIADSMTSSDGVTWTLKLRPNVKFSDGTAYDAAAVKFNWQRLQDPNLKSPQAALVDQIQSMDVVDAQTLRITLRSKNGSFPVTVSLISFIGSPTAIQARGAAFASNPVGAGPFTLKSWTKGSEMQLVRNPGYWNAPRPYLDQLVLRPIADEAQRSAAFTNGQGNAAVADTPQTASQLAKTPSTLTDQLVLNGGVAMFFNTTKAPFNDVRARQAVATAIDLTDYSKSVDGGLVDPADSIFRHDSPFFDPSLTQTSFNATKAQQLFDQLAADHGGPLNFTITASSAQLQTAAAQYVQAALNKFSNVKVTVQSEAPAQHAASCAAGTYDGVCTTVNGFDDPEPLWTSMFRCNATPSPTGWCNTKFDGSVVDSQQTLDPNQRVADIKAAQAQFYAEVPAFYVDRRTVWVFTGPNFQDFRFANAGIPLVDRMWIQSHSTPTTTPTTSPPPTTVTTRPPTTVPAPTTTTTFKPVTTTTAKPVTTTAKPTTTTAKANPVATTGPTTTSTVNAGNDVVTVTAPPTTAAGEAVALPATPASSERKPLPVGLVLLVVLLAVIFGVASTAAFMVWRQDRGW